MTKESSGLVFSHQKEIATDLNPLQIYNALCKDAPGTFLLETQDSDQEGPKHCLIGVKSALKAECFGNKVVLRALSTNGQKALSFLTTQLAQYLSNQGDDFSVFKFEVLGGEDSLSKKLMQPSVLDAIRALSFEFTLKTPGFEKLFLCCGSMSYDLIDVFEDLPKAKKDNLEFPNYVFWLPEVLVIRDEGTKSYRVISHVFDPENDLDAQQESKQILDSLEMNLSDTPAATTKAYKRDGHPLFQPDIDDKHFAQLVDHLKGHIVAGDVFQVVPSRTYKSKCISPRLAYAELRRLNPSPYMFYIKHEDWTLFGASPETFICVKGDEKKVSLMPIAGTRRRCFFENGELDTDTDKRREAELKLDEKELAEHMMLVDLARNDIARVCKMGTREVDRLLEIKRFSHVMHLVSHVSGHLREGLDALHAYQASMNMGTLVGAPKVKAAQILRSLETDKRGPYGGSVGYLSHAGEFDSAIVIRSALVKNGIAYVRAGAGVVFDSSPVEEAKETQAKAEATLNAICSATLQGEGAK